MRFAANSIMPSASPSRISIETPYVLAPVKLCTYSYSRLQLSRSMAGLRYRLMHAHLDDHGCYPSPDADNWSLTHQFGTKQRPFVPVLCKAIGSTLFDSSVVKISWMLAHCPYIHIPPSPRVVINLGYTMKASLVR